MGVVIVEWEGAVLEVNVGHPIETIGGYVAQLCENDALFPSMSLTLEELVRYSSSEKLWNSLSICLTRFVEVLRWLSSSI